MIDKLARLIAAMILAVFYITIAYGVACFILYEPYNPSWFTVRSAFVLTTLFLFVTMGLKGKRREMVKTTEEKMPSEGQV